MNTIPSNFSIAKFWLGLFLAVSNFIFSQDCNLQLRGEVLDLHDGSSIEGALIQVLETKETAISQKNGVFYFENQCPGKLNIKISHLNCEDLVQEVSLKKSTDMRFFMEHHIESLQEVIVAEDQLKKLSATARTITLSAAEKDRYSHQGLAGALQQVSGVNTLKTGNNIEKPMIHGMFGSRVGIIYDGVFLENQQWGQDHAPNVDQNAFENIRLIKGSGVLKYSGDTPGGVVVLESLRPKITDSLYGKTILNGATNGRGLNLVSSWVKSYQSGTYFKLQGGVRKNGDYSAPDYLLSNTGNFQNNFSFLLGKNRILTQWKLGYRFFGNEMGILRSSHIGNINDLLTAIESKTPAIIHPFTYDLSAPKQKNEHHTTTFEFSKRNPSDGKWHVQYSWQINNREEYDIRRGADRDKASIDLYLNTHSLRTNYEWGGGFKKFDSGVFFQLQDNYSNPNTGVKRLIPDYLKFRYGSFFTAGFSPSNDLSFDFGLRWERHLNTVQKYYDNARWNRENYQVVFGKDVIREVAGQKLIKKNLSFDNFSFNTGLSYDLSDSYRLGFNFYHIQRPPDISELFSDGLHHAIATIEYGNPTLEKETSQKWVLNLEKNSGAVQYHLGPYLTLAQNYIIIEPSGVEQTIRGAFPVWEYKSVNALLRGIDLDFTYFFRDHVRFKHSTSWVQGFQRETNTPLINIPPLNIRNQLRFLVPKWTSFSFEIISRSVFRQKEFPLNNFEVSVVENGQLAQKLVDISSPPSGYHDLGMEFSWGPYATFAGKCHVSLIFDNLLNASYRDYLNRLRFYADELGRNAMIQLRIYH